MILRFTCLSRSRLAMFSGEEMITSKKGLPSVEGPMSITSIRSLCFPRSW